MASKKALSVSQQVGIAERELTKRNAKQAVKLAKASYRASPSHETRELLGRCFLARSQELFQRGMLNEAKGVFQEYDALALADAQPPEADQLRLRLGLVSSHDLAIAYQEDPTLQAKMADQYVVQGATTCPDPQTRQLAQLIRQGLEAVEQGEFSTARERVAGVPRTSPFADWALFVRGLGHYYAAEVEPTHASWSRLDPHRTCRKLADVLLAAANLPTATNHEDAETRAHQQPFVDEATQLLASPLLKELARLQTLWGDWPALLPVWRDFVRRNASDYPDVVQRVKQLLVDLAVATSDKNRIDSLGLIGPPLPSDPHLHRAYARCHESNRQWNASEAAWRALGQDYQQQRIPCSPDQQSAAQCLIHMRLAKLLMEQWTSTPQQFVADETIRAKSVSVAARIAVELRACIALRPDYLPAYQHLSMCLRRWAEIMLESHPMDSATDDTAVALAFTRTDLCAEADRIVRTMAEQFPDDPVVQLYAADDFVSVGNVDAAWSFLQAALRLRPRDVSVATHALDITRLAIAELVEKGRSADARQLVDSLPPELLGMPELAGHLFALSCGLDLLEGKIVLSDRHWVTDKNLAVGTAAEQVYRRPFAAFAAAALCALQMNPSSSQRRAIIARLNDGWKKLRRDPVLQADLCRLAQEPVNGESKSPDAYDFHENLARYLQKSTRLAWDREDLLAVCAYLADRDVKDQTEISLARRGTQLFPNDPRFHSLLGFALFSNDFGIDAIQPALEKALAVHQDFPLLSAQEVEDITELLEGIVTGNAFGSDDDDDDDYDDDDDDDDDFECGYGHDGFAPSFSTEQLRRMTAEGCLPDLPPDVIAKLKKMGLDPEELLEQVMGTIVRQASRSTSKR